MDKIIKSPLDNRKYKNIILSNKIQVLLIYDKDSEKSAVSLAVNSGNYDDPDEYYGLAHFLEHMLFMGTEKYKEEDYFSNFINKHGGSQNAYTAEEYTNYFFDIQSDYFEKALDIFSQFFKKPLFNKDSVDREILAVDSEHSKNINSDSWRFLSLLNEIYNKKPFSKFGTGNIDTLKKDDIRNKLIDFYNYHYSSNLMKLALISNKNLDEIEKIVRNIFSSIPNKNLKREKYKFYPFKPILIEIVPISNDNTLNLYWNFPNFKKYDK